MHTESLSHRGVAISASGGALIGLLMAAMVILGGFSLVLGTEASVEDQAFPVWVDQRFAGADLYETVPSTATRSVHPVVVARAGAAHR